MGNTSGVLRERQTARIYFLWHMQYEMSVIACKSCIFYGRVHVVVVMFDEIIQLVTALVKKMLKIRG